MYKDPVKWAMTFQSYVTMTMLDMHRRPTATPVKLMERSVFSARYCFVEHMMRTGTLHPAQFAVLDEWFRFIHREIPIDVDLIGEYLNCFALQNNLLYLICKCYFWMSVSIVVRVLSFINICVYMRQYLNIQELN